ncbi:MAG: hypothetical protein HY248_01645 [Fimbriimonas ginsengisoli]|nr:hypothetical protein [Fimbriimonas ginsengisoli]
MVVQLPALAAKTVHGTEASGKSSAVALLRDNRIKAYRELERKLRAAYIAEVGQEEKRRIAALEPESASGKMKAAAEVDALMGQYAREAGWRKARLALLVGFPDPDPASERAPQASNAVAGSRFQEAKRLRVELAGLASKFQGDIREIERKAESLADERLTAVRVSLQERRAEAETRARREASTLLRNLNSDVVSALADQEEASICGLPGRTIVDPAWPGLPTTPKMDAPGGVDRTTIRRELAIWLAVRGYREAKSRSEGRDRTAEFLQWRRSHLPGP